ncbi:MAG: hypothetical protein JF589_11695 [Gemmatimonadetes bacterium]|nr:hypothetical protein [Gemmatimonadota bacterium]
MAADTFAADAGAAYPRPIQRFGRIVIVGGGCYGSYYVRQLGRAQRAAAAEWDELIVVDRDASCAVGRCTPDELPPRTTLVVAEWQQFFEDYLASAVAEPARRRDAIVPSPLMPHLMADWLAARARQRWPGRPVRTERLLAAPDVPWQRAGEDGTHYVSFAEWMCPINCIEPAKCPHTRGPRSWSLPVAVREYADAEGEQGRALEPWRELPDRHGLALSRRAAPAGRRLTRVGNVPVPSRTSSGEICVCRALLSALPPGEEDSWGLRTSTKS